MKNHLILLSAILMCSVSCVQPEIESPESSEESILTCHIENPGDTKVSLSKDNQVLWSVDDKIILYDGTTEGIVYVLDEASAGKTSGTFVFDGFNDVMTEVSQINHRVAFYPYCYGVYCVEDRADDQTYRMKGFSLPEIQTYMKDSIDPDAFPMAVVADRTETDLSFRNVCGVLKLQLYGDCVVSQITLTGNDGEKLSGSAEVILEGDYQSPEIEMSQDGGSTVTLDCGNERVMLNMHSPTVFMISIPPTEFKYGFRITVTDDNGKEYILQTNANQSVGRSTILRMPHISIYGDLIEPDTPETSGISTILETRYDGYDMHIAVPQSVKDAGNVIRWTQSSLMTYNYNANYYNEFEHLLYNASKWTAEDITLEYSDEDNRYQTGYDDDGDGYLDWEYKYDPIVPGEPVVFFLGEFAQVDETYQGSDSDIWAAINSWGSGYYLPLLDENWLNVKGPKNYVSLDGMTISRPMDDAWYGAFERQFFRVKEPSVLDGGVDVDLIEASPINLVLKVTPDDNVYQYVMLILDDVTYDFFMSLISDREEFKQWAITSYFSFYNFGSQSLAGAYYINAKDSFVYGCQADSDYHVLITAMGDSEGTSQSFQEYTFRTTSKVLPAPVIEVTPVGATAYDVSFNVKCTSAKEGNPVVSAYYAANYVREWVYAVNSGVSYSDLIAHNSTFTEEELSYINSDTGYTVTIPSIDGETTRFGVMGYNSENTPNDLNYPDNQILDCPAVADQTAEWHEKKEPVDMTLLEKLQGEWTATTELVVFGEDIRYISSSIITISDNACDYPSDLPSEVYALYKSFGYSMIEVDDLWAEFKAFADIFTEKRLVDQNRLLCTGWIEANAKEYHTARTPYELFIADDYSGYDVETMFYDFGPKWYIEAVENQSTGKVSFVAPFSFTQLPPASNWCGPFHIGAYNYGTYGYFYTEPVEQSQGFPVEYDEDNDVITIRPIEIYGREYHPNIFGYDNYGVMMMGDIIMSDIVLTRNASESSKTSRAVRKSSGVAPARTQSHYKPRTRLSVSADLPVIEVQIPTIEQVKENIEKNLKHKSGI